MSFYRRHFDTTCWYRFISLNALKWVFIPSPMYHLLVHIKVYTQYMLSPSPKTQTCFQHSLFFCLMGDDSILRYCVAQTSNYRTTSVYLLICLVYNGDVTIHGNSSVSIEKSKLGQQQSSTETVITCRLYWHSYGQVDHMIQMVGHKSSVYKGVYSMQLKCIVCRYMQHIMGLTCAVIHLYHIAVR